MYTFVCVCPSLAPRLGDACACVVVVRFASGGTLQVDRRLLNYASTDLYKRSAQHLQEDAGRDDAWEASPHQTERGRHPEDRLHDEVWSLRVSGHAIWTV